MIIDIETRAGVHVVKIVGDLSGDPEPRLVGRLTDLFAGGPVRIVIDMTESPFVNSAGLADLVRITGQANVQEGRVVLACIGPFVKGLLETTRLNRFFDVFATVDEAVTALNG